MEINVRANQQARGSGVATHAAAIAIGESQPPALLSHTEEIFVARRKFMTSHTQDVGSLT